MSLRFVPPPIQVPPRRNYSPLRSPRSRCYTRMRGKKRLSVGNNQVLGHCTPLVPRRVSPPAVCTRGNVKKLRKCLGGPRVFELPVQSPPETPLRRREKEEAPAKKQLYRTLGPLRKSFYYGSPRRLYGNFKNRFHEKPEFQEPLPQCNASNGEKPTECRKP